MSSKVLDKSSCNDKYSYKLVRFIRFSDLSPLLSSLIFPVTDVLNYVIDDTNEVKIVAKNCND